MRRRIAYSVALACAIGAGGAVDAAAQGTDLTAAQIVEKNVAARGGLDAWRKVQTMVWLGHVQSPHGPMPSVLFSLAQKRPNKTRFEISAAGQKTARIFDGVHGWKFRPGEGGRPEAQPFTLQEVQFARDGQGVDGLLIDHSAKGSAVSLEGTDAVDGRAAYRLQVRLASGRIQHVWVDAQSFLDIKSDRVAYGAAGAASGTVAVYYRDYKSFDGLQIPTTVETGVGSGQGTDRMVIERVVINPPVEDQAFTREGVTGRHRGLAHAPADAGRPWSVEPAVAPSAAGAGPAPEAR
jgi:hypothetical protein